MRIKRSLFCTPLLSLSAGRGGAKLYSNCAGEVTMIAFYCPLSPQVSARKVERGGEGPGGFHI